MIGVDDVTFGIAGLVPASIKKTPFTIWEAIDPEKLKKKFGAQDKEKKE